MPNKEPPKYIYLQWDDGDGEEITWCTDKIGDDDVRYVICQEEPETCPHGHEDWSDCPVCGH